MVSQQAATVQKIAFRPQYLQGLFADNGATAAVTQVGKRRCQAAGHDPNPARMVCEEGCRCACSDSAAEQPVPCVVAISPGTAVSVTAGRGGDSGRALRLPAHRPDGQNPAHLEIDEQHAAVVRQIFTWHAEAGWSLRRIARELTHRRLPTPKGGFLWSPEVIRGIVCNAAGT